MIKSFSWSNWSISFLWRCKYIPKEICQGIRHTESRFCLTQ